MVLLYPSRISNHGDTPLYFLFRKAKFHDAKIMCGFQHFLNLHNARIYRWMYGFCLLCKPYAFSLVLVPFHKSIKSSPQVTVKTP